jgi:hypothetical protein
MSIYFTKHWACGWLYNSPNKTNITRLLKLNRKVQDTLDHLTMNKDLKTE